MKARIKELKKEYPLSKIVSTVFEKEYTVDRRKYFWKKVNKWRGYKFTKDQLKRIEELEQNLKA